MKEKGIEVKIDGVICQPLTVFADERGWLAEIFRQDEVAPEHFPLMAYLSVTKPGVGRGPHAHRDQTDLFCFAGPGDFQVVIWDNRSESSTYGVRQEFRLGESCPAILIVPPGVVHGYKNVADCPGLVSNFTNRLYRGAGRRQPVDEIRFESDPNSPFRLE